MEFIANNIESKQWQQREAAVMAFGSILEGPSPDNLKPCIDQVETLLYLLTLTLNFHFSGPANYHQTAA